MKSCFLSPEECLAELLRSRDVGDGRWTGPEKRRYPGATEFGYLSRVRAKGRLAAMFVRLMAGSVRMSRHGFDRLEAPHHPVLYTCWHGSLLVPLFVLRHRGVVVMVSLSRDGDIQTHSAHCLGYRTVRGSSSRGGARALLAMARHLQAGHDATVTVDGPRGPFHKAKPGTVLLAQKSGAHIVPLTVGYSRVHRLKNWDKFEIPVPFSRVCVVAGEPFTISSSQSIQEGQHLIEDRLKAGDQEAARRVAP